MGKYLILLIALLLNEFVTLANEPDSVYLFAYATAKDNGRSGLHFAWSPDKKHWHPIGNAYGFVKSDYGRWGSQKQMNSPYLVRHSNGEWQCIWSLNETVNQLAHAASPDLVAWSRQSYPFLPESSQFTKPVVHYDKAQDLYLITYRSDGKYYQVNTKDFDSYSSPKAVTAAHYTDDRLTVDLPAGKVTGTLHWVAWDVADQLVKAFNLQQYKNNLAGETAVSDSLRFAGLKPVSAAITLKPEKKKAISDLLVGVFFEDINYAADGGLYAELVENRDFEYAPGDKDFRDTGWNSTHSWSLRGTNASFIIDSTAPVHPNNAHYAVLRVTQPGAALFNSGFDGIPVKKGAAYDFSLFAKNENVRGGRLLVKLIDNKGAVLAQSTINPAGANWKKYTATLTASADAKDAQLAIQPLSSGLFKLDLISLFPQATFKARKNGLRADLAETVAAIQPRFVRFPGGCVAHGDGLENIYRWKNTIGPLESRKPQRNLWGYHQSAGLGYFEYFQYCEDIGAEPLPVVAAGVPCQNSGIDAGRGGGQQGGIPMSEMDEYVQDVLDLIEWANGPATSKWGKLRAQAGHPEPFNLKYIGIGNEDLITDVFEERFSMIYNAVKAKHPEITIIGTVGPFFEGTDYREGWEIASKLQVPMVDEHYYESPGWFINHQTFYDTYDRKKSKVYLGEYASRGNTLYNALAEAAYLTGLERNGDVVHMTSYAPLLAKEGRTQWNPDLIYFSNTEVNTTVNYEVQKLYGQHSGDSYIPTNITTSNTEDAVRKRIAVSAVLDSASKDLIIKLVNLLPIAVNTAIDLKGFSIPEAKGEKWVLQGKPGDKNVKPVQSKITVGHQPDASLPPYSFTVIRVKTSGDIAPNAKTK